MKRFAKPEWKALIEEVTPEGMTPFDVRCCQKVHDANSSNYSSIRREIHMDHQKFVTQLNKLPCFADVVRVES